jgi:hypothetical protein
MEFLQENKNIVIVLVIALFALYLISNMTCRIEQFGKLTGVVQSTNDSIDNYKVDMMKCSPQCCSDQWPTGIESDADAKEPGMVANSFRCSNGVVSGCPCMNKEQSNFLSHRGDNFPLGVDDVIPDSYMIYPENKKLYENKTGPVIGYVATQGQLYGLPNHGGIFNASSLLK